MVEELKTIKKHKTVVLYGSMGILCDKLLCFDWYSAYTLYALECILLSIVNVRILQFS